jgi:hypothetical protein
MPIAANLIMRLGLFDCKRYNVLYWITSNMRYNDLDKRNAWTAGKVLSGRFDKMLYTKRVQMRSTDFGDRQHTGKIERLFYDRYMSMGMHFCFCEHCSRIQPLHPFAQKGMPLHQMADWYVHEMGGHKPSPTIHDSL